MKAIVQSAYGPPREVLELRDVDDPVIGDDQVLVKVQAASVAIGDWLVVEGLPYIIRMMGYGLRAPKSAVPGSDIAGTIEAVGKDVTRFAPGDEVFGMCKGALAERAAANVRSLAPKPANLSFEQAAAVPTSALTALQGLRDKGELQSGQKVLIIGASGGVGTFAVQIAKALGAHVTAVCSTPSIGLVQSIGADAVIDYTREEITDRGERYDVILDMAGNRSLSELRSVLTPKGTLVIGGGSGGRWLMGSGRSMRAMMLSPFIGQTMRTFIARSNQEDLVVLKDLIEAGKMKPVIDGTYPLSDIAEAIEYLGERHTQGKTVITV
ncbi:NAD(P)-dependent alcohol dehydrogenase [bacterium]|nr:NAD(P)-dependent alcohol dehydrogenase [bacterium]